MHTHARMHVQQTHTDKRTHTHTHTHTDTRTHTDVHTHTDAHTQTHTHRCTHTHMHTHTHTHTHTQHRHTHTHTHTQHRHTNIHTYTQHTHTHTHFTCPQPHPFREVPNQTSYVVRGCIVFPPFPSIYYLSTQHICITQKELHSLIRFVLPRQLGLPALSTDNTLRCDATSQCIPELEAQELYV